MEKLKILSDRLEKPVFKPAILGLQSFTITAAPIFMNT